MSQSGWIYLGHNPVNNTGRITLPNPVKEIIGMGEDHEVKLATESEMNHLLWREGEIPVDSNVSEIIGENISSYKNSYSVQRSGYFNIPSNYLVEDKTSSEDFIKNQNYHFITKPRFQEFTLCYFLTREEIEDLKPQWEDDTESLNRLESAIEGGYLSRSLHPEYSDSDVQEESRESRKETRSETVEPSKTTGEETSGTDLIKIHENNSAVDARIHQMRSENPIKRLFLLDYSAQNAVQTAKQAAYDEAEIFLLMKYPQAAITDQQYRQVTSTLDRLLYPRYQDEGKDLELNVMFYNQDSGLRARRIDDRFLILGWYTYVLRDEYDQIPLPENEALENSVSDNSEEFSPPSDYQKEMRKSQKIWGEPNPMLEISSEHPDFPVLDRWFRKKVYAKLWETGVTPWEAYEHEMEVIENSSLGDNEILTPMIDLVEEGNRDYIKSISSHAYSGDTLFD